MGRVVMAGRRGGPGAFRLRPLAAVPVPGAQLDVFGCRPGCGVGRRAGRAIGGTGHILCPSVYDGRVLPAVTALLSGDSRKVMLPGRRVLARAAGARCQLPSLASAPGFRAVLPWPTRTWMRLACTSGALGTMICSTPSWAEASILSASTCLGRVIERRMAP